MSLAQRLPPSVIRSKGSILVIDDAPDNLRLLTQLLSSKGYDVRVALNGQLALASIQTIPPDLILLDIMMPGMNGYALCEHLKADQKTRDIPIIFISALDDELNKVNAFSSGGVDYITKPFSLVEVIARIENQLRLRDYRLQLQVQNTHLNFLLTTIYAINDAVEAKTALQSVIDNICQIMGWDWGEAWLVNSERQALEYCADVTPHRTAPPPLAPGQNWLGRVWVSQTLEWLDDAKQTSMEIESAECKSALAIPILGDNQVLAVLGFFCHRPKSPDDGSLELVRAIASQLAAMMQRKAAEAELRQVNHELENLAILDGLTQIANRRCFDDHISREWRRLAREGQPLSLILCDVDYFKRYNDSYGHQAGDRCLQVIAQTLQSAIKRPADLAARYGGEEFAVILPNTAAAGARVVAESIRRGVEHLQLPHAESEVCEWVTLSLGIACMVPTPSLSLSALIAASDKALYEAKHLGRNRCWVAGDC